MQVVPLHDSPIFTTYFLGGRCYEIIGLTVN